MGYRREDLTSRPVLFWPVGGYLVIYRAERHPIEIVAEEMELFACPGGSTNARLGKRLQFLRMVAW
jgi:hypothetical protein